MNTREQAEPATGIPCSPARCAACGAEFNCGAQSSVCWCAELKLTERVRARLRERYTNCLCRACLEGFLAEDLRQEATQEKQKLAL